MKKKIKTNKGNDGYGMGIFGLYLTVTSCVCFWNILTVPYNIILFLTVLFISLLALAIGIFFLYLGFGDFLNSCEWHKYKPLLEQANEYLEYNKTSLGRFARPGGLKATQIILANKFVILEFNVKKIDNGAWSIVITDKINMEITTIKFNLEKITWFKFFADMCSIVRYKTNVGNFIRYFARKGVKFERDITKVNQLYLDINQAAEAELTALPGVTIAKAKHAIKVRNQQKLFLTMNQFYEVIDLDEEFIEQIQTSGNKIILNELPEYKKLQLKREK